MERRGSVRRRRVVFIVFWIAKIDDLVLSLRFGALLPAFL